MIMFRKPHGLEKLLQEQLQLAQRHDQTVREHNAKGAAIIAPRTGKTLSVGYEHLRNAAENTEEQLRLQRAIKRFAKRTLFKARKPSNLIGQELIIELVLAGYLENGTIGSETATRLSQLISNYLTAYEALQQSGVERKLAKRWILGYISVEVEHMLNPSSQQQAIVVVAYQHFLRVINRRQFDQSADSASYEACLYVAVHLALLKSERDTVRYELYTLYQLDAMDVAGFKHFNEQMDRLYKSELTIQLSAIIGRYGAPFRVLGSMLENRQDTLKLLQNQQLFMDMYRLQISNEYRQVRKRMTKGLIKSIIFIVISKVIIGVGIEVPYDLILTGSIAVLPLTVNLLFPPLYMASLRLSITPPTQANAQTLSVYTEEMLYGSDDLSIPVPRRKKQSRTAQIIYTLFFLLPVALTIFVLQKLGFNLIQMAIFFTFFSTASFLGFRLSIFVRELELITPQTGLLASLRDSFYMPFIRAGQWISKKYSRVNLVTRFLDIAIELPLKTILSLIRQWVRFLNDKRDALY
jgi:hypothetical protein